MPSNKVIDLSHPLWPGRAGRMFELETLEATQIIGAEAEQDWYIMHRLVMDSHIGTHMEVPYHCFPEAADLARVPVEQLVGKVAILELRGYGAHEAIPLEAVQRAAVRCGGVGRGDIARASSNRGYLPYPPSLAGWVPTAVHPCGTPAPHVFPTKGG